VSNLNKVLTQLKQASGTLNQELEAKNRAIGKIKEMLKDCNKENINEREVKPVYGKRVLKHAVNVNH